MWGRFTHVTEEQERKQEGQTSPHPGLETLWEERGDKERRRGDKESHRTEMNLSLEDTRYLHYNYVNEEPPFWLTSSLERKPHITCCTSLVVKWEKLTHGDVHVVLLSQSSQSVQAAALIVVLQELDEAYFANRGQNRRMLRTMKQRNAQDQITEECSGPGNRL